MSTQNHYAIFRFRKLKADSDIINAGIHNERLKIPPNADASRVALNRYYAIKNEDLLVRVTRMISERASGKHRRDAIRAIEIICTTSRGWNGNLDQWTLDSLNFVEQTFGKSNIVSAALHQDETTPHLHLVIVPIHEGKLRGSHWIDGPKKCQVLQDGYHAAVKHHGLEPLSKEDVTASRRLPGGIREAPRH
jgi:hypothetical protein